MIKEAVFFTESILHKIDDWLNKIETAVVVSILSVLLILGGVQIVLRKFFNMSIADADLLTRNLVSWLAIVGATIAAREERHISIDLTENVLSGNKKKILKIFINCVVIWVCLLFLEASFEYISQESTSLFVSEVFGIAEWKFSFIFPVGFCFIIFHYGVRVFSLISELVFGAER